MTSAPIAILGGYGNFGKRIAQQLTARGHNVVIIGRNLAQAEAYAHTLPHGLARAHAASLPEDMDILLDYLKPCIVIHCCGPFQGSDYQIAQSCIRHGVHYVDLADAREFVCGITTLHEEALASNVAIISGASSVPALSSAVIEQFRHEFASIERIHYSIAPGNQAERGLATTQAILSYVGKPIPNSDPNASPHYGWQSIHRHSYPHLGTRWLARCDIPDTALFPKHYGIKRVDFFASLELPWMHFGLWGLSWLVRLFDKMGLPLNLPRYAPLLLKAAHLTDRLGSADGAMHVRLVGIAHDNTPHTRSWCIIARDGYGPYIPTIPAVLLADQAARGILAARGAMPCVGLIALDDYLAALKPYPMTVDLN